MLGFLSTWQYDNAVKYTTKILSTLTFIATLVTNFFANSLPINNRTTGDISDSYPNLFAPAGPAFSIWGLIYLLLGIYVIYQFANKNQKTETLLKKINPPFIATSIVNISWILAWHYDYIGVSLLLMATLLILLIKIADILRTGVFTPIEKLCIWTPFSVYFGWITVASIANFVVFLVNIGWNGLGISEVIWTNLILLVGTSIGIIRMFKDSNIAYGMVLFWAYFWILFRHMSDNGFDGKYPSIIATLVTCLILFGFYLAKLFITRDTHHDD